MGDKVTASRPLPPGRRLAFTLTALLAGSLLALVLAEATLHLLAVPEDGGYRIGQLLVPVNWPERVARNRDQLRALADPERPSFLVPDPLLGWTVGRNRSGQDEALRAAPVIYHSSLEGIRSPSRGVDYRAQRPGRRVVALVGDSFAFSLQSGFSDSIGGRLQDALGPGWLVLNFAVNGYGVDQTWLRYREDVRPWQPEFLLFGLSNHDLVRTLVVYPFVSFSGGWLPFAKPRFVLAGDGPVLVNVPLIGPEEILAVDSVTKLPFIEHDYGYLRSDWAMRRPGTPLLRRWWQARFPRPVTPPEPVGEAALLRLNTALIAAAHGAARAAGTVAVGLLYPAVGAGDFRDGDPPDTYARRALRTAGEPWWDLTACLKTVPRTRLLAGDGIHYSPRANAAAALCLADALEELAATGTASL